MALTLYGLHGRPHDFVATKAGLPLEQCVFFLDFSRRLEKIRRFAIGPAVGLLVPVVHEGEQTGGYVISVRHDEPYFRDLQTLWKQHYREQRTRMAPPVEGLRLIADFGTHFPQDL